MMAEQLRLLYVVGGPPRHSLLLQRGGHVTLPFEQRTGGRCYLRLRPCANSRAEAHQGSHGGHQKEDENHCQPRHLTVAKVLHTVKPVLKFARTNFLPLALITGVTIGLVNPVPGCLAQKYSLSNWSTFGIFLVSGLTLRSGEMSAAIEAWPAGAFGLVSILLFTPFISRLVLQLKLIPQEFVTGLAMFCCMPTTLSSGVALTQVVGGNSALALSLTVASNLLGIVTVPFMLSKLVAQGVGVSVPAGELLKSLTLMILVPLLLGKGIRNSFNGVAKFVDERRELFSMINSIFLSLVPWMQVSGSRALLLTISPMNFISAIAIGMCLHFIFLSLNTVIMHSLSLIFGGKRSTFGKENNARAIIIVASQKTLPVMVAIVGRLGGVLGEAGLLVIPCVAAHINQIIMDSFLVNIWLQKDKRALQVKET